MTITRKISLLIFVALVTCCVVFGAALHGLASMNDQVASIAASIQPLLKSAPDGLQANLQSAQDTFASTRTYTIIVVVLGLGLIGGMGFFFWRSVIKPLSDMQTAIAKTADKLDFTDTVTVTTSDEIGNTLSAYNRLLARLRDSFTEIQRSTAHMLEVTEEVDLSSRKIARNSQIQSDASANMAASVEEMTVSISVVAQQAKDASQHTQDSRDIAAHSAGAILDTVGGIQKISDSVREAATRIKTLRDDCDSITSVANIIREIADQTNLLALNAAIEAARAGEQGRGFAVVADEVRKLAERTAKSTQDISSLVFRMQDSAKIAVDSMSATEQAVAQGVVNARQAGESIESIKEGSSAAAGVVEEISGAIREQQAASTEIAQHIEQIAQMSEQNSVAASASAAAVGRMSEVSREIAHALSAYKVEANAQRRIDLRVADIHGDDHPAVRALRAMSEMLKERTQGRITLKVGSKGAFGSEKDALEQTKSGALDMTRVMVSQLNKDCPAAVIPTLPFLFRSIDHMQRAVDGQPGQDILASCASGGYVGLAFYDSGARSIYANKPIRSIADVRGIKLRVPQSDLWIAVANAMGAKATPMSIDEIIAGQRMGLIDAAENNIPSYEGFKHFEVFNHFSLTEHAMAPDILVFSKKRWDSLSAEDQEIIASAARESVTLMRRYWKEREDAAKKALAAAGVVIVSGVDKKSFQDAMRPVYDRFVTTDQQRALLRAIQDYK